MKKELILLLFILSFIFIKSHKNNYKEKKKKYNNKVYFKNRKLQEEEEDQSIIEDLNIYIDMTNIDANIPTNWDKEIFNQAMIDAKENLESFLLFNNSRELYVLTANLNNINDDFVYDSTLFSSSPEAFNFNFGVFINFDDLNEIPASTEVIIYDDFNFPKIAVITINKNLSGEKIKYNYLKSLFLHEFTHAIAFNEDNFALDNELITVIQKEIDGIIHSYIASPKVLEYAKKYFSCDNIDGIEIETDENDNPGIHWSSRYLLGDYMTKFNYNEEQVISGFTLALFEDLGYLKVKKHFTGGLMRYGKNKGCEFLEKKCLGDKDSDNINDIKFENEFYYPITLDESYTEPSCSSGRLSRTVHKIKYYENDVLYQYFNNKKIGGSLPSADYCPISQYSSSDILYESSCTERGELSDLEINLGQKISDKSFCALSSLVNKDFENYETLSEEIRASCYNMYCSERSLTIQVGNDFLVCPRGGGKIKAKNYEGYLLCPDFNLICTGKIMCNELFDCLEKGSEEDQRSFIYEENYNLQTTQDSSIYIDQNVRKDGYELSNNGKCPLNCAQCNINDDIKICVKCPSHLFLENNQCIEKTSNCKEYDDNSCILCDDGYYLIKENNEIRCSELTIEEIKLYYKSSDSIFYIKCNEHYDFCEECTDTECEKCFDNYGIIGYDKSKCEDLSNYKYYKDPSDDIYKVCSQGSKSIPNCEKCQLDITNNLKCTKCNPNYAFLHNIDSIECIDINLLENDNTVFPDEEEEHFYKCSSTLQNCLTCENKDTCITCETGYDLYNNGKTCLSEQEFALHYLENGELKLCSESINGCNKCTSKDICNECKDNYKLNEEDKCFHESLISIKYYFDTILGQYISCSNLENCDECSSKDICTRCINGYHAQEGKCQKIIENQEFKDKDHDKLMSIAVGGIIIGTISLLGVILIILYILWNKFFMKNKVDVTGTNIKVENDNETIKYDERNNNDNELQSNKRSIHNTNNNNN